MQQTAPSNRFENETSHDVCASGQGSVRNSAAVRGCLLTSLTHPFLVHIWIQVSVGCVCSVPRFLFGDIYSSDVPPRSSTIQSAARDRVLVQECETVEHLTDYAT